MGGDERADTTTQHFGHAMSRTIICVADWKGSNGRAVIRTQLSTRCLEGSAVSSSPSSSPYVWGVQNGVELREKAYECYPKRLPCSVKAMERFDALSVFRIPAEIHQ